MKPAWRMDVPILDGRWSQQMSRRWEAEYLPRKLATEGAGSKWILLQSGNILDVNWNAFWLDGLFASLIRITTGHHNTGYVAIRWVGLCEHGISLVRPLECGQQQQRDESKAPNGGVKFGGSC